MSINPPLNTDLINIFFDESGQDSDKPSTMVGLLIPSSVYDSSEMRSLNEQLQSGEITLHWTAYTGHAVIRENIKNVRKDF